MHSTFNSVMKKAVKRSVSAPMRFLLKSGSCYGFIRQIIREQPWLVEERGAELARQQQAFETRIHGEKEQFQQQMNEFRDAERERQRIEHEMEYQNLTRLLHRKLAESSKGQSEHTFAKEDSDGEKAKNLGKERIKYVEPAELISTMIPYLEPADVVLDIGCGIMPQNYLLPRVHICCEPFAQYVEVLQKKLRHRTDRIYTVLNSGWSEAVEIFPEQSVDTIFICDVIEHLEKEEGRRLLEKTIAIARKQVVIFTPLGYMPQHHSDGKDAWGLDGGQWQEHKSGWNIEDFDDQWQFIISKTFHEWDNQGNHLEKPFGAFWAVRNNTEKSKGHSIEEDAVLDTKSDTKVLEMSATFPSGMSETSSISEAKPQNTAKQTVLIDNLSEREYCFSDANSYYPFRSARDLDRYQMRPQMRFAFIVGCPHSGTSIALRLLSEHPDIYGNPDETYLFTENDDRRIATVLLEWEAEAKRRESHVVLEKTPYHLYHAFKINEMVPDCRFIGMLRDGRDLVASLIQRGWSLDRAIDNCMHTFTWMDELQNKLSNFMTVKLEDLQSFPKETLGRLLSFLGVPYSEAIIEKMLHYHENPKNFFGQTAIVRPDNTLEKYNNVAVMRNFQLNQPLKKDTHRWKNDLSEEQQIHVVKKLSPWLEKYEYV